MPRLRISFSVAFVVSVLVTETAFADEASATNIEALLSSRSEAWITMTTLNERNLVIEASYPRSINSAVSLHPPK